METVTKVYQKWTAEEKLAVREAQYMLGVVKEQFIAAVKNAEQGLINTINKVINSHGVDPKTTELDLVSLEYKDKK